MNNIRLRVKLFVFSLWQLTVCVLCLRARLMGFAALGALLGFLGSMFSPVFGLIPVFGFSLASYLIARKKNGHN